MGYGKTPTEVMSFYVAVLLQVRRKQQFLPMSTLTLLEIGKFPKINTVLKHRDYLLLALQLHRTT